MHEETLEEGENSVSIWEEMDDAPTSGEECEDSNKLTMSNQEKMFQWITLMSNLILYTLLLITLIHASVPQNATSHPASLLSHSES